MSAVIHSLHQRLASAAERSDRDGFASLFHPRAVVRSGSGEQIYHGREGVDAWYAGLTATPVFEPTVVEVESVGDDAWFLSGRLQMSAEEGGLVDAPMAWLIVLRDELIWRSQPVRDRREAHAVAQALKSDGPDRPRAADAPGAADGPAQAAGAESSTVRPAFSMT
jgi:hypothetical protein